MRDIPDQPFKKIAIDLIMDLNVSTSGNQYILTIIDQLTGWPEAFPSPTKMHTLLFASSLAISFQFTCVPGTYCPIMEQNSKINLWTMYFNNINHIFSAPYNLQSNETLEVFCKYIKPRLKKLCENDQDIWDQYLNQVLTCHCITPHLTKGEKPLFFIYG